MKEIVMCNNNLRLKSPLTRSTDHYSLLKHHNFDFAHFLRGGDSFLKSDFYEGRVTKIFNFALKIKGVVGRVAHAKSSDPATPQNLERAQGKVESKA